MLCVTELAAQLVASRFLGRVPRAETIHERHVVCKHLLSGRTGARSAVRVSAVVGVLRHNSIEASV